MPAGTTPVAYPSGCACPDGHITSQGRPFSHVHVRHSLPLQAEIYQQIQLSDGTWVSGMIGTAVVTNAMVESFWDHEYGLDNYSPDGDGISLSVNCHGFTLGYDTWVQSTSEILEDDGWTSWTAPGNLSFCETKDVVAVNDRHSSKRTYTLSPDTNTDPPVTGMPGIIKVFEVFRSSATYKKTGNCTEPIASKSEFHAAQPSSLQPLGSFSLYVKPSSGNPDANTD